MKLTETELPGAYTIELEPAADERGYYARTWCEATFASYGLNARIAQCGMSYNSRRGTLRGMHWQARPFAEAKTVRCQRGAIYDVIVDLRPSSPAYKRWSAARLSADNGRMLYVPEGFAHGYLTLADDTEVAYTMSNRYDPASASGFRWDDPAFAIDWPPQPFPSIVSERDRQYPPWREEEPSC